MNVGRKIVGSALAAVAAAGLVFGTSAPAAADVVEPHKHCLLTPEGWVLIAEGVTDEAPNDPALESFHTQVHRALGGGEPLTIRKIGVDEDC